MSKVAIVSDSNSGITQSMAKELGVTVMPMPFFVGDKTLYEDIDLSQEEFYQMLSEKTDIHTSMPIKRSVMISGHRMYILSCPFSCILFLFITNTSPGTTINHHHL